jgi:GTPase
MLQVWNKIDLVSPSARAELHSPSETEPPVAISAFTGEGVDDLLRAIDSRLTVDPVKRVHLRFTQTEGRELSWVYEFGRVLRRQERDGLVEVEAELPESLRGRLQAFIMSRGASGA